MQNKHFKFSLNDLGLQKSELIHMFGNQDSDIITSSDWRNMMAELDFPDQIQGGYSIFENVQFDNTSKEIIIENVPFKIGPVLFPRFKNVEKIAVTLCTAGPNIDLLSKSHLDQGETLLGYCLDALGAVIVEKVLENVRFRLRNSMRLSGYAITACYCPGYCDWQLSEQTKIFNLLPGGFCNVALSNSCLMIPLKSISGLIGIGMGVQEDFPQCRICSMHKCHLRKEAYSVQIEND
jgi:hypothetical protein